MTQTARAQISEMTETTEATLARTFGWETPEARLYRECPSAFWLAPDGGGVLPPPPAGPAMPQIVTRWHLDDDPANAVEGKASGIFHAMLAAGPIFAATAMLLAPTTTDRQWWDPLGRAAMTLVAAPLTMIFGAVLALLPVLAGVLCLAAAGKTVMTLRKPAAWTLTGGIMGAGLATLFDAGGPFGLAMIATSVACAAIARRHVTWTDAEPA